MKRLAKHLLVLTSTLMLVLLLYLVAPAPQSWCVDFGEFPADPHRLES